MVESKSWTDRLFTLLNTLLLVLISLVFVYPMWYVLCASLSNAKQLFTFTGFLWRPLGFSLMGYRMVLRNHNILVGYGNTLFYVIAGTALNVFFSSLAAYVLSRRRLMFKKFYNLFVVFTMYFSGGMIPNFLLIKGLGLYNSRLALLLPGLVGVYNMIIMRTSFKGIPPSLEESAKLDGAGDFTVLFRIILPCAKATVAVMILYYAVGHWNAWFNAMVYLKDRTKYPLQLFLREILLVSAYNAIDLTGYEASDSMYVEDLVRYCTIIVSTVPILCIYPFAQKYFMKGALLGSVKE